MSFLIAGWLLMIGGAAGRWVDPLTLPGLCNCYRRWWTAASGISDGRLDVSPSVVGRLWRSYQETGEYTRNRVNAVPWWQPQNQTVFLLLLSLHNRISTAWDLEIAFRRNSEVHLRDQTVRNKLHCDGTRARRPARGAVLTTIQLCWQASQLADSSLEANTLHRCEQFHWVN